MIIEMLRKQKVDILKYLPDFLAKDPRFEGTAGAISKEHERIRGEIADVLRQMFIETATWGLDDWERIYGLTHASSDTYTMRRGRLKAKILGTGTITRDMLEMLVNSVLPTHDAIIVENVAPSVFRVDLGTAAALAEIRKVIDTYKPAHLTYILAQVITSTDGIVSIGGIVSMFTATQIDWAEDLNIEIEDKEYYLGGVVSIFDRCRIGGL